MRYKNIMVVTRDCNGENIVLMKRKTTLATWLTLGLYRPWRDWRLENEKLYNLYNDMLALEGKAVKNLKLIKEQKEYLKAMKAEILGDRTATRGISAPYEIKVDRKELSFKKHKFIDNPGEKWRGCFNPQFLAKHGLGKGKGGAMDDLRTKVGAPPSIPAVRSKYVPKELNDMSVTFNSEKDVDHVVPYVSPPKHNNNKRGNQGGNNRQRNQSNTQNNSN